MGSPMTCAYCTRRSLVTIMIDCERQDNFYFVAFVFIKEFTMFKKWFTLRYAPLRPYVNRCARRIALFVWDWLPDLLVILVSVWILMQIWEMCFWH